MIYGSLQLLPFMVINTIWLFLMITPILCGFFPCGSNMTPFALYKMFSLMSPHNLAAPSKQSSAIMAMSSIMLPLTHSLPLMG
jgi:hypothetical protein